MAVGVATRVLVRPKVRHGRRLSRRRQFEARPAIRRSATDGGLPGTAPRCAWKSGNAALSASWKPVPGRRCTLAIFIREPWRQSFLRTARRCSWNSPAGPGNSNIDRQLSIFGLGERTERMHPYDPGHHYEEMCPVDGRTLLVAHYELGPPNRGAWNGSRGLNSQATANSCG